jgi:endonuclease-3
VRNPLEPADLVKRLEAVYGPPEPPRLSDPLDELICCILSQHTTDATSFPAFDRLKAAYPEWGMAVTAGQDAIADIIRNAGLANQKSKSILGCLRVIHEKVGSYSLDLLRTMPMLEGRAWLMELPGVGPKTASIVLCFSLGLPAIPVDTHIHRVSLRIGFLPPKMDANKAHDELLRVVPPDLAYPYHMALIRHGRAVCKAPKPRCGECVLAEDCPGRVGR